MNVEPTDIEVLMWDEISGQSKPVPERWHPAPAGLPGHVTEGLSCSVYDHEHGMETWECQYVADFQGGIRVVVESDDRAHTAILLTRPVNGPVERRSLCSNQAIKSASKTTRTSTPTAC